MYRSPATFGAALSQAEPSQVSPPLSIPSKEELSTASESACATDLSSPSEPPATPQSGDYIQTAATSTKPRDAMDASPAQGIAAEKGGNKAAAVEESEGSEQVADPEADARSSSSMISEESVHVFVMGYR